MKRWALLATLLCTGCGAYLSAKPESVNREGKSGDKAVSTISWDDEETTTDAPRREASDEDSRSPEPAEEVVVLAEVTSKDSSSDHAPRDRRESAAAKPASPPPAAKAGKRDAKAKPRSEVALGDAEGLPGTVDGLGGLGTGASGGAAGAALGTLGTHSTRSRGYRRPAPRPVRSPGVKAGAADDNLQFGAFLEFMKENARLGLRHDVSDRVVIRVQDKDGLPVPGAHIRYRGRTLRRTYADGRALIYPRSMGIPPGEELEVRFGGHRETLRVPMGRRRLTSKLSSERGIYQKVPLDIAFVLDTTGSMGDEIARLRQTIEVIKFQISQMHPKPDLRLGLVLFRDQGDAYRTKVYPFTGSLRKFQQQLNRVRAGGGGDTPEDVQAGLEKAMHGLRWRGEGLKLAFLIGDAAPHLDYGQQYTYLNAVKDAAERGIKIATIGASGLDRQGELVWRQIAQYTMSPFVFLTYGEQGNSEGGTPSSVSHHVGSNWVAENLDAIVVRMVKTELAHYSVRGAPQRQDYFSAGPSNHQSSDEVLGELFDRSVKQLIDYSVERIEARTPTIVLPVSHKIKSKNGGLASLERRLEMGMSRSKHFQLLERRKEQELLKALSEQMSMRYDHARMIEAGRMVPAQLAVLSQLDKGEAGQLELLLKLVRLQTGEILSLSLLKIDSTLIM